MYQLSTNINGVAVKIFLLICIMFNIECTLMKNFCAVPSLDKFPDVEDKKFPGEIIYGDGNITLNRGRKAVILKVVNTGDRPVQVFFFNLSFLIFVGCFSFFFLIYIYQ